MKNHRNIRHCFILFLAMCTCQFLRAQTGVVLINRTMGDMDTPKTLVDRDVFVAHTFVAFVQDGIVLSVAGWGEGNGAGAILAGHWVAESTADWSVAQAAIDQGKYTLTVAGGTLEEFFAEVADAQDGWSHPNLGFLFNCKWAAWVLGNNFSFTANGGVWTGVANIQPVDTWADDWMQAHLHPGYWMALQRSAFDPFAISDYENAVAAQHQNQNPWTGQYYQN